MAFSLESHADAPPSGEKGPLGARPIYSPTKGKPYEWCRGVSGVGNGSCRPEHAY